MKLHLQIVALATLLLVLTCSAGELAKLVVPPAVSNKPASPIAIRSLDLARREVAALSKSLHPWDKDPRAKLFTAGGHTEHHVRPQTQTMIAYAVVARFSPVEAERRAALADLIAMLRFVAPTHSAGPVLCSDGKKWKDQWQSALWAAQAGAGAWLVWDQLDDELRELIANMLAHEADRFVDQKPPHQIKNDTKAEENAWDSMPIALAACMMPTHPRAKIWRETAIRWQLSSFVSEADCASDKIVDGKALKDYRFGPNIHPDFTLENHNRVHPSYMGTIGLNLDQHLFYKWAKTLSPESLNYNAQPIYNVLKKFAHPDGRMHFPNGQDWELHRLTMGLHTIMSTLFGDPEAACLEETSYQTLQRMAARTPDGPTCLKDEYFFPSYPGMVANDYAITFLFHLEFGDGTKPIEMSKFLEQQSGVFRYDEGKFILSRSPAGFMSFSWGAKVMGQAIPFTTDLMGSPYELGFVGTIKPEGAGKKEVIPAVKDIKITTGERSFTVTARLERADGAVEQQIAFVTAGPGAAIYAERIKAIRDFTPTAIQTGTIGVLNEPEWAWQNAPRTFSWAGGTAQIDGRKAGQALAIRSPWLSIDKAWNFVPIGAEGFSYEPSTKINRGRREQLLWLTAPELRAYKAGEVIVRRGLWVDLNRDVEGARLATMLKAAVEGDTIRIDVGGKELRIQFAGPMPEVR